MNKIDRATRNAKIHIAIGVALFIAAGCTETPEDPNAPKSERGEKATAEFKYRILGCDVYYVRVEAQTPNMNIALCDNSSSIVYKEGKQDRFVSVKKSEQVTKPEAEEFHTSDDIGEAAANVSNKIHRKQSDEDRILELADQIKERREVLDKLSEHDREILGLESTEIKEKK